MRAAHGPLHYREHHILRNMNRVDHFQGKQFEFGKVQRESSPGMEGGYVLTDENGHERLRDEESERREQRVDQMRTSQFKNTVQVSCPLSSHRSYDYISITIKLLENGEAERGKHMLERRVAGLLHFRQTSTHSFTECANRQCEYDDVYTSNK